jgi:hypothetical protein
VKRTRAYAAKDPITTAMVVLENETMMVFRYGRSVSLPRSKRM